MIEYYLSSIYSQPIFKGEKRELWAKGESPESWNLCKLLEHSRVTSKASQVDDDSKGSKAKQLVSQAKIRVPGAKQMMTQKGRLRACGIDLLVSEATYQVLSHQKESESWYAHPRMVEPLCGQPVCQESSWQMVTIPSSFLTGEKIRLHIKR